MHRAKPNSKLQDRKGESTLSRSITDNGPVCVPGNVDVFTDVEPALAFVDGGHVSDGKEVVCDGEVEGRRASVNDVLGAGD